MKKSELCLLAALIICIVMNYFTDVNTTAGKIRSETIRLHIIAHDNSPQAQSIKLEVRDRLQPVFLDIYHDADSLKKAMELTENNIEYIQSVAQDVLNKYNTGYSASCSVENFMFDTTVYDGFTLPRGEYTALTVRLGDAAGKNWWCVAYPTLCISSAAKYEDDSSNTFIETDSCRIKFKTVEIWEKLKHSFSRTEKYNNL